ncbi:hypothetical protein DE146DRAFT_630187 [Phaeosphaeria sp. MPI-PUGE-AT-0046c]|nr:hypothetical protein DE146DRAFT_630187 [Phaeosphaeria sp. MPI-PUGE-AT-0046c]
MRVMDSCSEVTLHPQRSVRGCPICKTVAHAALATCCPAIAQFAEVLPGHCGTKGESEGWVAKVSLYMTQKRNAWSMAHNHEAELSKAASAIMLLLKSRTLCVDARAETLGNKCNFESQPPYNASPRFPADCNNVSHNGEGPENWRNGCGSLLAKALGQREGIGELACYNASPLWRVWHLWFQWLIQAAATRSRPFLLWSRRRRHCGGRSLPSFLLAFEKVYMTLEPCFLRAFLLFGGQFHSIRRFFDSLDTLDIVVHLFSISPVFTSSISAQAVRLLSFMQA